MNINHLQGVIFFLTKFISINRLSVNLFQIVCLLCRRSIQLRLHIPNPITLALLIYTKKRKTDRREEKNVETNQWTLHDTDALAAPHSIKRKQCKLNERSIERTREKKHHSNVNANVMWFNFVSVFGFVYVNLIFFKHEMLF